MPVPATADDIGAAAASSPSEPASVVAAASANDSVVSAPAEDSLAVADGAEHKPVRRLSAFMKERIETYSRPPEPEPELDPEHRATYSPPQQHSQPEGSLSTAASPILHAYQQRTAAGASSSGALSAYSSPLLNAPPRSPHRFAAQEPDLALDLSPLPASAASANGVLTSASPMSEQRETGIVHGLTGNSTTNGARSRRTASGSARSLDFSQLGASGLPVLHAGSHNSAAGGRISDAGEPITDASFGHTADPQNLSGASGVFDRTSGEPSRISFGMRAPGTDEKSTRSSRGGAQDDEEDGLLVSDPAQSVVGAMLSAMSRPSDAAGLGGAGAGFMSPQAQAYSAANSVQNTPAPAAAANGRTVSSPPTRAPPTNPSTPARPAAAAATSVAGRPYSTPSAGTPASSPNSAPWTPSSYFAARSAPLGGIWAPNAFGEGMGGESAAASSRRPTFNTPPYSSGVGGFMGAGYPVGPDGVFVSPRNVGPVLYTMTPGSFDHASRLNSPAGVSNTSRTNATPATNGGARLGFTPSSAMSSRRGAPDSASSVARSGAGGAATSALNTPNNRGTPSYRVVVTPAQHRPGSTRGSVNTRYPAAGSRASMAASPSPIRSPSRSPVRSPSSSAATAAAATAVVSSPKLTGMFDASPIHPYPAVAAAPTDRSPNRSPRFTTREDVMRMQRSRSASPAAIAPRPVYGRASPNAVTPAAATRFIPAELPSSSGMRAALAARSAQSSRGASQSASPVRGSIYSRPLSADVMPASPRQTAVASSRSAARVAGQTAVVDEAWLESVSTPSGVLSLSVRRSSSLRQLHRFALFTLHPAQQPDESVLHSITDSFVSREFSAAASSRSGLSLAFRALKAHADTAEHFTLVMVFDVTEWRSQPLQAHEWIGKFVAAMGSVAAECSFIELRPAHWR